MKVGIIGGSFNPIHNCHLDLARYVIKHKFVDEVWIMPCKIHPLNKSIIPENFRVDMINLAIKDLAHVKLCDIELKKKHTSYTYGTLRELKQLYDNDFYLIMGADLLKQLDKWKGYEQLKEEAKFIVFSRPGYVLRNPGLNIARLVEYAVGDISSTDIRERIKQGRSIEDLIPKVVAEYILKFGLYVE